MSNKIKTILVAAVVSSMVLTQGVCVSAAQFDDGQSEFSDGTETSDATGSVSALASALAKQTEEQTQKFVAKEEEAAQIREERRVEKAEKASVKAEQEKAEALKNIQQTIEDTKKKAAEEAEAKRVAKRQEVVNFALQFEGNPYVYGGNSLTNGIDCSGFVQQIHAKYGISTPRNSTSLRYGGKAVAVSDMMPGDVVCYEGHVAIYIGGGQIVHASNSKPYPAGGIKTSNAYYRTIVAVRRYW